MMNQAKSLIGGTVCHCPEASTLIDHEDKVLTKQHHDFLWDVFVEIGRCWGNMENDSASIKSSWREFIVAKTEDEPSYVGEYANAVGVIQELVHMYGRDDAFRRFLLESGVPDGPPTTRLAHAKRYVIDEFIRVQVVAGGFKGFVKPSSLNHKGYVGGSRYNRLPRVRAYQPDSDSTD